MRTVLDILIWFCSTLFYILSFVAHLLANAINGIGDGIDFIGDQFDAGAKAQADKVGAACSATWDKVASCWAAPAKA